MTRCRWCLRVSPPAPASVRCELPEHHPRPHVGHFHGFEAVWGADTPGAFIDHSPEPEEDGDA